MSKLLKTSICATHLVAQVAIYGGLTYIYFGVLFFMKAFSSPRPLLLEFLLFQSTSILASLFIALVFIIAKPTSFRLNAILTGSNFVILIAHSAYFWTRFNAIS